MVGTWLAGQRPGPADPDAGTVRPCDIRVEGRSVSGPRAARQTAPVLCTERAAHTAAQCLQMVKLAGAGQQHGLLLRALGRQQTSMPSGSGLLPGPTLRAPRAQCQDLGHWFGWTIPVIVWFSAGRSSAEHSWPPLVVT